MRGLLLRLRLRLRDWLCYRDKVPWGMRESPAVRWSGHIRQWRDDAQQASEEQVMAVALLLNSLAPLDLEDPNACELAAEQVLRMIVEG